MSYILLLVFSLISPYSGPKTFTMSEFQSQQACEVALNEAKKFYRTVNNESRCISVKEEVKKAELKQELEKLNE